MTAVTSLSCPKCGARLKDDLAPPGAPEVCRSCDGRIEGVLFPAYLRPPASGKAAEALVAMEDAGCFYHPQSRAQVPCDLCGRFLCALCDVELGGQHLCPSCLTTGQKKNKIQTLDKSRILYGGIAIALAVLPLLAFWPLTIVTGPLTVFFVIFAWRKPGSLTGKGRVSFVIAFILGLIVTAGWVLALTGLFKLF